MKKTLTITFSLCSARMERKKPLPDADLPDEIRKLNDGRTVCDHFSNGYCAPCKFDCPCYKDGKCVEAK